MNNCAWQPPIQPPELVLQVIHNPLQAKSQLIIPRAKSSPQQDVAGVHYRLQRVHPEQHRGINIQLQLVAISLYGKLDLPEDICM